METSSILAKINEVAQQKNEATKTFIDRVVTVSSSMLVLSIAFRKTVAGDAATNLCLLKIAWIALAIATVCGVFVHLAAASAGRRTLKMMKAGDYYAEESAHPVFTIFYMVLLLAFPSGIVALMLFGVINLG